MSHYTEKEVLSKTTGHRRTQQLLPAPHCSDSAVAIAAHS